MFRRNIIYIVVVIIGLLLLGDIWHTNYNNKIITKNRQVRQQINRVATYYDQVGKVIIHSLDIGLRGYAIVKTAQFLRPLTNALEWKDSIFMNVEVPLKRFDFNSDEFEILKDSVNSYTRYCIHLKALLDEGKRDEFLRLFEKDRGGLLWRQYTRCERSIVSHLDAIDQKAVADIEAALDRNQLLQIFLFLICIPTLLYTAYYTGKTFRLSELLRASEKERNEILLQQNITLEKKVSARTHEILTQNEEITAQSEELATQRDALHHQNLEIQEAHRLIEIKNQEIQEKNASLEKEITNRTQDLRNANQELIEHNNQLEQFSFIAAHNLRAPLARILGLANIIEISENEEDRNIALKKVVSSSVDLDAVVKDLSTILDIRKHTSNFSTISLSACLDRVIKMLEKEREETNAEISFHAQLMPSLYAVAPYVESVFYNLIGNAIKYRHPERSPLVTIKTVPDPDYDVLVVSDNGLGIDLNKHRDSVFSLYKRFHIHVEGKGLGLFLVKGQMLAMGGKIDIESEPGKGTSFYLCFKKK